MFTHTYIYSFTLTLLDTLSNIVKPVLQLSPTLRSQLSRLNCALLAIKIGVWVCGIAVSIFKGWRKRYQWWQGRSLEARLRGI